MAGFSPASPVTGAPGTGLTSPTYTLVADAAPAPNAKQWYVSALGGTQTGVVVSSVNMPFTTTVYRPAVFARLPPVNPVTGVLPGAGKNVHAVITRKGALPLAGQTPRIVTYETKVSIPAGCESADFPNLVAGLSEHIGSLWEQSNEWCDAMASGAL
jgi:hypothetical protein